MSGNDTSLSNDLQLTVRELSATYEEISLLYRLAESMAGMDVQAICQRIIAESLSYVEAETAAVMFIDEELDSLYTMASHGDWDRSREISRGTPVIMEILMKERAAAFCDLCESGPRDIFEDFASILICPMIGKKRTVGLLIIGNKKVKREFFSNDIKLVNAIARLAALFIENATLTREMENFLLGTIRSFVKALEATSLWTAGHTERVTDYALAIGRELSLDANMLERLKICSLLHDIGKIATPKDILNKESCLSSSERHEIQKHSGIGADILEGLEKFTDVVECIKYHHEYYNGKGSLHGLKGEDIPLLSRILAVADAFDAITSDRPYRKRKSTEEAIDEISINSGGQFDPRVVDAFRRWVLK